MNWVIRIFDWIAKNIYWIVPAIFALINVKFAQINAVNAKEQRKTAEAQLRLALLDKRMKVYNAFQSVISKVISEGDIDLETMKTFHMETREADFLFGQDIVELINNLYKLLGRLYGVSKKINDNINLHKPSENHSELCEEQLELKTAIYNFRSEVVTHFTKYMCFSDCKVK